MKFHQLYLTRISVGKFSTALLLCLLSVSTTHAQDAPDLKHTAQDAAKQLPTNQEAAEDQAEFRAKNASADSPKANEKG